MTTPATLPLVKLENFEGPFDLLLELAHQQKIDLSTISLKSITDSFLAHCASNQISSSLQADFLIVASTLLLIKIHQLLPELTPEEEEEVAELSDRLRIYQLYRAQAQALRRTWDTAPLLPAPQRLRVIATLPVPNVTIDDLYNAMHTVEFKIKAPLENRRHFRPRGRSLRESLELLHQRLQLLKSFIFQKELYGETRQNTAVSFLALLELARQRQIQITQEKPFAELVITIVE